MATRRSSAAKKNIRKQKLRAPSKKAAKTGKQRAAARKAVATQKLKAAGETLPTAEQVEEIEEKLRTGAIVETEPIHRPKTKKEIQESLKDYKERVKWTRMRGAKDKVEPEAYAHTIEKLEEMLKRSK